MKTDTMIIIGVVVLVVVLIGVAMFIPAKSSKPVKEKLYGVNYNIEGHEAEIDVKSEKPVVAMYIEGYGSVIFELYPEYAPNTVNNFISLVKKGFYDNNTFHRLMPGFVLQGGDPTGTGGGDPGYSIKGEFMTNGVVNNTLKHEKGVLSMARANDPDSAGSQFFIMLGTADHLDGSYAAFGKVIKGMDVVEAIEKNEAVNGDSLVKKLSLKKALYDLNGYEYVEPIIIENK